MDRDPNPYSIRLYDATVIHVAYTHSQNQGRFDSRAFDLDEHLITEKGLGVQKGK